MKSTVYPILLSLLILGACASVHTSSSTQSGKYSESLSPFRIPADSLKLGQKENIDTAVFTPTDKKEYVPAQLTVNDKVSAVVDSLSQINLDKNYVMGSTIQIFFGLNKDDALEAKRKFDLTFPKMGSDLIYRETQPNFRVKTGSYLTDLSAQKDFLTIKHRFSSAIIIPDKVPIP